MIWRIGCSIVTTFADDTRLSGVADSLEDRIRVHNDLYKLEKLFKVNQIKLSKSTCKVLCLGQLHVQIQIREPQFWLQCCTKGPGIIVDCKMYMSNCVLLLQRMPIVYELVLTELSLAS